MERLPLSHRLAHRLARSGIRGASWYWRLARFLQREPAPGVVWLPDGTPIMHDPRDWTCRTAYEGTYEREVLQLLAQLLNEGDIVVDVGANVGIISAHASRLVGQRGRVIAIEPSPRCTESLNEVTRDLVNVDVVEAALGEKSGTLELTGWDNPDHRGLATAVDGHRAGLEENWFEGTVLSVPQLTLETVLVDQINDEDQIALLKVDVEGYEPNVLRGAPDLFSSRRVKSAILEVTTTLPVDWVGELLEATADDYRAFSIKEIGALRRRLTLMPVETKSAISQPAQWNLLLQRV